MITSHTNKDNPQINPSAPPPKDRGLLRIDTESGAIFPHPKGRGLSAAECIKSKVICLKGICKKYPLISKVKSAACEFEDFHALKDISLEVEEGAILGVIGRNGAGKTTLLNIIVGVLSPTGGEISVKGKVLGLFNLGVGFQDELTGRENIFLNGAIIGATRRELESKQNAIIDFSELGEFIDMPLGAYSQGMRLRLAFSVVASLDFDILVIDEVLAVGDSLFQNKCFERLMDFKRQGKTLIITTQSMELIERLSDKVVLLDHGRLIFAGTPIEGINKYYNLVCKEKFFVGPVKKDANLVENTKKWAEDDCVWERILGTKEVEITSVRLINKFGRRCNKVRSREPLTIKVCFKVKNKVRELHFGVAIFRKDRVYCYGPNSAFDGYYLDELKEGQGYFKAHFYKLLLAPGEYLLSVAIWDKNEVLAFDYHVGYYQLIVYGNKNHDNALINMPFRINAGKIWENFRVQEFGVPASLLSSLEDKWKKKIDYSGISACTFKILNSHRQAGSIFTTKEPARLVINFSGVETLHRNAKLWVGIYRDDMVYCQGITLPIRGRKNFEVFFPQFLLLPGKYRISLGVWDTLRNEFLMSEHGIYNFNMVSKHKDHGTIFIEHKWSWQLP